MYNLDHVGLRLLNCSFDQLNKLVCMHDYILTQNITSNTLLCVAR